MVPRRDPDPFVERRLAAIAAEQAADRSGDSSFAGARAGEPPSHDAGPSDDGPSDDDRSDDDRSDAPERADPASC